MVNQIIVADDAKILVIMPRFLGDAVMATSALQLIRQLYPTQHVYLLVRAHVSELFSEKPLIDEKIIVDKRFTLQRFSLLNFALHLKSYHFQLVYHFRNSFADALLCRLAGIKLQVGYSKNGRSLFLSHKYKLDTNFHYQYRYCNLVKQTRTTSTNVMPTVKLNAKKDRLQENSLVTIVVYFGGKNKTSRHYPFELAIQCLSQLAEYQPCHFVLLGDHLEITDNNSLVTYLKQQHITVTDLTNRTSVSEMVNTINNANLLITIDSGQMHIAAALGIPYVAVVGFGTSPWSCVAPKVVHGIHLLPNSLQLCLSNHIREITPEQITTAAYQLLQQNKAQND